MMAIAAGAGCTLLAASLVLSWTRGAPIVVDHLASGAPWWHEWVDVPPALGLLLLITGAVLHARVVGRAERVTFILGRQWKTVRRAQGCAPASAAERAHVARAAAALSDNRCSLLLLAGAAVDMSSGTMHPVGAWSTAAAGVFLVVVATMSVLTVEGARRAAGVLSRLGDDRAAPHPT